MTCVETLKLDLISDFLLQLLPGMNGVWTNFWNSFLLSLLQLQWVYLINDPLSIVMQYLERCFTRLDLPLVTIFSV